jgi:hypothetical protein
VARLRRSTRRRQKEKRLRRDHRARGEHREERKREKRQGDPPAPAKRECGRQRLRTKEELVEEAVKEDDVGVTLADSGEDGLVIRGPGDAASDESAAFAEVGDGMHGTVGG